MASELISNCCHICCGFTRKLLFLSLFYFECFLFSFLFRLLIKTPETTTRKTLSLL